MKPSQLIAPFALCKSGNVKVPKQWSSIGNTALLVEVLCGLMASRECPGSVLLETLDKIPNWVKEGRVILSGFHSPLEQQVLHSVLRRKGRVVKLIARGLDSYRVPNEERESLDDGRMLILTTFSPDVRHITRATALERNRLVLELANEMVIPYIAKGSPLSDLVNSSKHTLVNCTQI